MFYICFQMITGVCFVQFVVAQQALKWQLLNMLHSAWKVLAKLDQGNTVKWRIVNQMVSLALKSIENLSGSLLYT